MYKKKKISSKYDVLKTPILWNPCFGSEDDPYDNRIIQTMLRDKIALLFECLGIEFLGFLQEESSWSIRPPGEQRATAGIAKVPPFFNLAIALAFKNFRGFDVVRERAGPGRRSGTGKYPDRLMKKLGEIILKERRQRRDRRVSEKAVIERVIKQKGSSLYGMSATGVQRAWKLFKAKMLTDDETYADALGIPISKNYRRTRKRLSI